MKISQFFFKLAFLSLILSLPIACQQQTATAPNVEQRIEKPSPRISFEKTVHNFGELGIREKGLCQFKFKNTGTALLKIGEITASCGCTVPNTDQDAYMRDTGSQRQKPSNQQSLFRNPYLFTASRVDILDCGSLIIQYNSKPDYDYYIARWLTQDPLGITVSPQQPSMFVVVMQYKNGMNLYEYVKSDPVLRTDPHALITLGCCKAALTTWLKRPTTRYLYEKALTRKDAKGKPCLKKIKCTKCSDKELRGWYDAGKRIIFMCGHKGSSCNLHDWRLTIEHELIHAISLCGSSTTDCKSCMIEEKRARYLAFQCFSDWECTLEAWWSCTRGKKPNCDKNKDQWFNYIGVGWPPDPNVVF